MEIRPVVADLLGSLPLGSNPGKLNDSRGETSAATSPTQQQDLVTSQSFRGILARYDVTDISATDFSALIQELYDAGAIGEAEQEELTQIRLEVDRRGIDPRTRLDLLALIEQQLTVAEAQLNLSGSQSETGGAATQASLEPTVRQLEWLQKLAAIHADGEDSAFDILA